MYQKSLEQRQYIRENRFIIYPTLGLTGEAGEVANKVKKIIRDDAIRLTRVWFKRYPLKLAMFFGISLYKDDIGCKADIANANLVKLANRKEKGTIHGSSDKR